MTTLFNRATTSEMILGSKAYLSQSKLNYAFVFFRQRVGSVTKARVYNLHSEAYMFKMVASTSAGKGPPTDILRIHMPFVPPGRCFVFLIILGS